MSTPYDDSFKALVRDDPLAFVRLVFPNAQRVRLLREKLKEWKLEVDALFEITLEDGELVLVHFEFQTYNDADMAGRLLRYNILLWSEYHIPVCSCVIHVLGDGKLPTSPFDIKIGTKRQVIQFYFDVIELGELSPEEIVQTGQPNLFPLLPFTKGGAKREIVETVFEELTQSGKTNLLSVAQTLASLAFGRAKNGADDQEWLIRRYKQMFDVVKDTPVYKEMVRDAREEALKEGREEGLEKGRKQGQIEGLEQGREEGQIEGLQQGVMEIIASRFPRLVRLATGIVPIIESASILRSLIVKMSTVQTAAEAKEHLLAVVESDEDQEAEQI